MHYVKLNFKHFFSGNNVHNQKSYIGGGKKFTRQKYVRGFTDTTKYITITNCEAESELRCRKGMCASSSPRLRACCWHHHFTALSPKSYSL